MLPWKCGSHSTGGLGTGEITYRQRLEREKMTAGNQIRRLKKAVREGASEEKKKKNRLRKERKQERTVLQNSESRAPLCDRYRDIKAVNH